MGEGVTQESAGDACCPECALLLLDLYFRFFPPHRIARENGEKEPNEVLLE